MFLGMLPLANAGDKYKKLKDSLDDDYLKGNNTYPNSPEHALTMLSDHVPSTGTSHHSNKGRQNGNSGGGNGGGGRYIASNNSNTRSENVSFLQTGNVVAGANGRTRPEVQCWSCQAFGHYQDQCPTTVQLLQASIPTGHEGDDGGYELSFNQFDVMPLSCSVDNHPSGHGVVMDTGSTINTIKDSELLTNIKRVCPGVKVLTNGGEVIYDMMGTFQGALKAWYNPDGMASILSFSALCTISKVSFVSAAKNMFLAEFSDGRYYGNSWRRTTVCSTTTQM